MKEDVFVYYHCDQWKMSDSMSFVGVFDEEKLKQVIIEDLKNNAINLDDKTEEEILLMDVSTINTLLEYGHIELVTFNERC